ncbi:MAG: methyltransferase domain-containing protein [Bacteroidetes bacterium]|nr:methyltransferase domain-containing protein [Bacteroidota bacterium]
MGFISETQKIRSKIAKYLNGKVADIGCGHDPVIPDAFGIDCRPFPHVKHITRNLNKISEELGELAGAFDVVYSSHCLEHFHDDIGALSDWVRMAKDGGYIILYLPDDRFYRNDLNPDHVQRYEHESFVESFLPKISGATLVESGPDVGDDRYSFYVVLKKSSN